MPLLLRNYVIILTEIRRKQELPFFKFYEDIRFVLGVTFPLLFVQGWVVKPSFRLVSILFLMKF